MVTSMSARARLTRHAVDLSGRKAARRWLPTDKEVDLSVTTARSFSNVVHRFIR